ncbi:MAG: hypothetical protein HXS40_03250 [Theionarchaea archaeon]|nr:hypothetical protein [Theionarchaea archaeon]
MKLIEMKRISPILIILVFSLSCVPASVGNNEVVPENTVIISNETDESFCRDFSVLLRRVKPEWVIVNTGEVPERTRDKNLIIIGGLDAVYTGEIITGMITQEERDHIQNGTYVVLTKESPWAEARTVYICTGSDNVLTKKAAEELIVLLGGAWVFPPFLSAPPEEARDYITSIQYLPEDDELPMAILDMDVDAKPPSQISHKEAAEDVEYLFYLMSHGYCGYGYFKTEGDFAEAKTSILTEVEKTPTWSPDDLSRLIHDNLAFVHDCHLKIGEYTYGNHQHFWYDTDLELWKDQGEYSFILDGTTYSIVSINGECPDAYIFPSLNAEGDPIYRIGTLSESSPPPLVVGAQHDQEQTQFQVALSRSDFDSFSKDIFREDSIGGIPVVRIRSFSDHHSDYLNTFISTAQKYRGAPCLIIDLRGNGGGNEQWPRKWVTRFTGQEPSNNRYFTEFISKTTMMGRRNYFEYLLDLYPDTYQYQTDFDHFEAQAEAFENQYMHPHWTGPFSEGSRAIPSDTTLIVVINGSVASAAEGFIMYLQQVENVVLVGENTMGALVFGQMTLHKLPNSALSVRLPISLNIPLNLELREERGFFPDVWIPAEDAVNYVVAAVRKGTITTTQQLPAHVLQEEFIPERRSLWEEIGIPFIVALLTASFGIVFVGLNRKRGRLFFLVAGMLWAAGGVIVLWAVSPLGYSYLFVAALCIFVGLYKWKKEKATPVPTSNGR